jgi:hypothetical protein
LNDAKTSTGTILHSICWPWYCGRHPAGCLRLLPFVFCAHPHYQEAVQLHKAANSQTPHKHVIVSSDNHLRTNMNMGHSCRHVNEVEKLIDAIAYANLSP